MVVVVVVVESLKIFLKIVESGVLTRAKQHLQGSY
jgi:hypothetical protein